VIDVDQSGFIAGHIISENFVYATEMVQCCFKGAAPTLVLKLDFAKAFDSVNWASLRKVMLACGFPKLWCDWRDDLFTSSRFAVLLNGIPGKWIKLMRGPRQGDPLSPYLFLLMADVLQRLVQRDGALQQPIVDGAPAPSSNMRTTRSSFSVRMPPWLVVFGCCSNNLERRLGSASISKKHARAHACGSAAAGRDSRSPPMSHGRFSTDVPWPAPLRRKTAARGLHAAHCKGG
jgi:hypothetical protein